MGLRTIASSRPVPSAPPLRAGSQLQRAGPTVGQRRRLFSLPSSWPFRYFALITRQTYLVRPAGLLPKYYQLQEKVRSGVLELEEKLGTDAIKEYYLLEPGVHYLNHGSYGAAFRLAQECQTWWQRKLEAEPCFFVDSIAPAALYVSFCRFLGGCWNSETKDKKKKSQTVCPLEIPELMSKSTLKTAQTRGFRGTCDLARLHHKSSSYTQLLLVAEGEAGAGRLHRGGRSGCSAGGKRHGGSQYGCRQP